MSYSKVFVSALTGIAGGLLFALLHWPLPWMLGPAFAIMTMNAVRPGAGQWSRRFGDAGVVVVAYLLGRTMSASTGLLIVKDMHWMVLSALLWMLFCIAVGLGFAKAARIAPASGMLGSVPGGLTQMVLMADDDKRADPGTVAIMQTSRLIVVLYTVPFLATWIASAGETPPLPPAAVALPEAAGAAGSGLWPSEMAAWLLLPLVPLSAWLAKRWKLPAGEFIGPVLFVGALSMAGCPWPALPGAFTSAAQLLIGIYIGSRVQPRVMISNKRLAPLSLLNAVLLVGVTLAVAWGVSSAAPGSIVTWFLSMAPGGLSEAAITAMLLDADVAKVTAYQSARLLVILLAAPLAIRLFKRWL